MEPFFCSAEFILVCAGRAATPVLEGTGAARDRSLRLSQGPGPVFNSEVGDDGEHGRQQQRQPDHGEPEVEGVGRHRSIKRSAANKSVDLNQAPSGGYEKAAAGLRQRRL